MKTNVSVISIFLALFISKISFAQSPVQVASEIQKAELFFEPRENFIPPNLADTALEIHKRYKCTLVVYLTNVNNIAKIHMKLGSTPGDDDVYNDTWFNFDEDPNQPFKTYLRQGNIVYLGLGNRPMPSSCYAQVKLESATGSFTTPLNVTKN